MSLSSVFGCSFLPTHPLTEYDSFASLLLPLLAVEHPLSAAGTLVTCCCESPALPSWGINAFFAVITPCLAAGGIGLGDSSRGGTPERLRTGSERGGEGLGRTGSSDGSPRSGEGCLALVPNFRAKPGGQGEETTAASGQGRWHGIRISEDRTH